MLISSSIPNFVNGISQQPSALRLASQGEAQENGLSTVSQGLKKRPPTKHLKKILSAPLGDCFIHTVNRDVTERYLAIITNGDLKVYDLDGIEKTVVFPDGKTYLSSVAPSTSFSAVTVADYTFIVNKGVMVTSASTLTATRPYEGLVNIKAGNYGKTYEILINGAVCGTYTTPDGSNVSHTAAISTDAIASQLRTSLLDTSRGTSALTVANGWTLQLSGSTIYISRTASDFSLNTKDGFNNGAMIGVKGRLQKFSDLPANPSADGFVVEITGTGSGETATQPFDSYYVKFTANTGTTGVGVWKECPKPGIKSSINATTMPFLLVREASGTFTFKKATFKDRVVGDDDSNPFPSAVDKHAITDVFFYKNRLGLLADEAVIFSEAGEYFNFSRTTVTQLLDSDPIDVNASHTKVSLLKHAVPYNKSLLLFSEQTQFIMEQNELLTPKSISMKVATEFPCNTRAKPVAVGKNVYFSVDKGDHSALREYYTDMNNVGNDATDITAHIPEYIPSGIFKISTAANEDLLVAISSTDQSSLYVYKYFFASNEKLQSSWSRWSFGSETSILNADFLSSELLLVINRPDGVYLEKLTASLGDEVVGEPYTVHLDRKVQLPSTALSYADRYTTLNLSDLGYSPAYGDYQVVVKSSENYKAGEIFNVLWDGTTAKIFGDLTGSTLTFGRKYTLSYALSTVLIKQQSAQGGSKSDTEGRLQLRKITFNYADAGFFTVAIKPEGRDTYQYTYSGRVLGQSTSTIGRYSLGAGRFAVPVISRNIGTTIVISNDSPLPSSFISADWEGFFQKRSMGARPTL